jgi:hypothetical protein
MDVALNLGGWDKKSKSRNGESNRLQPHRLTAS